ncbi:unnamed protein product [Prorocentrum cordatum]|uniref:Uncharacterized protein n=1 Tax=Prorocentrum cordatum TaxID=2364126 RepID=A0ABN9XGA8_9DINO|nr:unnamed protein product [Polarella glacialis]
MGEHLRGKLEGMIASRFENYLRIIHTLQNETGKLAALECELFKPSMMTSAKTEVLIRVSISCNEDGTFLVYTMPDSTAGPQRSPSLSSSGSQDKCSLQAQPVSSEDSAAAAAQPAEEGSQHLGRWVEQVCEFGMSGRCHSLTALFHFGYTTWKQMLGHSTWPGVDAVGRGGACGPGIAEEEERPRDADMQEAEEPQLQSPAAAASAAASPPPLLQQAPEEAQAAESEAEEADEPRRLLQDARKAAECDRHEQALDICTKGVRACQVGVAATYGSSSASSSAAAARAVTIAAHESAPYGDHSGTVQELLLLRARTQARLRSFDRALRDAEDVIALQPTRAEGYYWQAISLQGLGHLQEALESLMSALEYEPQNPLFTQAFTQLFEQIREEREESASPPPAGSAPAGSPGAASASDGPRPEAVGHRRGRGSGQPMAVLRTRHTRGPAGDALSTTTQATRLSSRSTTPTEVAAPLSHSSSNDSLSVGGAAWASRGFA